MAADPVRIVVPVAWGEMDAFAHVNNTAYLRWFESARIVLFERSGLISRMASDRIGPILARATIDYRRPVVYPDTVTVACWVAQVGKTSAVLAYRATSEQQGGAVVAEGETVVVQLDYRSGAKVAIEGELRERLLALVPPA
jgi:acyl-CoA thioester hydrolase